MGPGSAEQGISMGHHAVENSPWQVDYAHAHAYGDPIAADEPSARSSMIVICDKVITVDVRRMLLTCLKDLVARP
jgi:hypothetical protein